MKQNQKKILFITQQLNCGGVEKALINLVNNIDKKKYECDLLVVNKNGGFLNQLPDWLKVKEYDCPEYVKEMLTQLKKCEKNKDDSFYVRLDKMKWNSIFLCYRIFRKLFGKNILYKIIFDKYANVNQLDENYDMVVDFHGYGAYTTYLAAFMKTDAKRISWIHEETMYATYSLISDCFTNFDMIFGCSLVCVDNFKRLFPNMRDRVSTFYNILDIAKIKLMASGEVEEFNDFEGLKITSVGNIIGRKAFNRVIEAAKILDREGIVFRWIVIGDGNLLDDCKRSVIDNKLVGKVQFVGYKDNPYIYINNSDLYVQTSISEGYCTTITEAIILGKPVVTTRVSGTTEQLGDNEGGFIVEHSAEEIARGIIRMADDPQMMKNMEKYNLKRRLGCNDEIEKLYELLEEK